MSDAKRRGSWSDTLPIGQDVAGAGFPSYNGGAFTPEWQVTPTSDKPEIAQKPDEGFINYTLRKLGVFGDKGNAVDAIGGAIGGAVSDGISAVGDATVGAFWRSYGTKLILGLVGTVLLIAGIWTLFKGTNTAKEISAGVREGIAAAKAE